MTDDKPTLREPAVERERKPLVDRYRSGDEIARGGMGRVVEAVDTRLERVVAVKEALTADPEHLRRFARETRITAKLEHPSIVPLYDASAPGDAPYYVMRRVSGRPLETLIAETPKLAERLALVPHVLAAAQAIAHAHGRDILHRDVKPSNILVGEHGETVVIDWGLAKEIDEPDDHDELGANVAPGDALHTRAGQIVGTPGFMSPEQCKGEPAGKRGDVYALGATLYFLLAQRPPHDASSGTEMIEAAAAEPARPIVELVPGVPRELSAIVASSLAFDPAARYPHAGAFAEDLARFLRGQLVASHRYSTRERLVRLVRRHRAAFAIGAIALVVVAIGAWLSVSRIIAERDRADVAADDAERSADEARRGRTAAEAAGARERDRADQMLLSRAHALTETNPTAAIALLRRLPTDSPRVAEARTVAKEAVMRGVAFAIRGTGGIIAQAQLARGGRYLAVRTFDLDIHVFDLDQRREILARTLNRRDGRAMWQGDKLVLLESTVSLLDPATGAITVVAPVELRDPAVAESAPRAMGVVGKELCFIDLATHEQRRAPLPPAFTSLAIAPDGAWYAVVTASGVTVHAWTGAELTHTTAANAALVAASPTRVAFTSNATVHFADARRGAAWTVLTPVFPDAGDRIHQIIFRDEEMYAESGHALFVLTAAGLVVHHRFGSASNFFVRAGTAIAHAIDERHAEVVDSFGTHPLSFPNRVPRARVAGARGSSRLVVVGDSTILVYETADFLPAPVPIDGSGEVAFFDENTLFSASPTEMGYTWFDLRTGRATRVPLHAALVDLVGGEVGHRMALVIDMFGPRQAVIVRPDRPPRILGSKVEVVRLIDGDALAYSEGGTQLAVTVGDAEPKVLATFDKPIDSITPTAPLRLVAATSTELLRADLATGAIERVRAGDGTPAHLAAYGGAAFVARGKEVLRWTEPLAKFHADVVEMFTVAGGILVPLADQSVSYIALDGATPHVYPLLAVGEGWAMGAGGSVLAVDVGDRVDFVELPSRMRWAGPLKFAGHTGLSLSPSAEQLLVRFHEVWRWHLPVARGDLRAWLASLTNAVEDDGGVLRWPWESAAQDAAR